MSWIMPKPGILMMTRRMMNTNESIWILCCVERSRIHSVFVIFALFVCVLCSVHTLELKNTHSSDSKPRSGASIEFGAVVCHIIVSVVVHQSRAIDTRWNRLFFVICFQSVSNVQTVFIVRVCVCANNMVFLTVASLIGWKFNN